VDKGINWYCESCNWISCNDCCLLSLGTLKSTNHVLHKRGSSINIKYTSSRDTGTNIAVSPTSSVESRKSDGRRGISMLQDALIEKDQQVRYLERYVSENQKYRHKIKSSFALGKLVAASSAPLFSMNSPLNLKKLASYNCPENLSRQMSSWNTNRILKMSIQNTDSFENSADLSMNLIDENSVLQDDENSKLEETDLSFHTSNNSIIIPLKVV